MQRPLIHHNPRREAAFTMVEIAISLAVIGFALVALIGVMPFGMNTQRDNREETIINEDATVLTSAIRNGMRGYDELTNYVNLITNFWTDYAVTQNATNVDRSGFNWYTYTNAGGQLPNGSLVPDGWGISNGFRIVGLLSTPKYIGGNGSFRSNYILASVRAMSGLASEKAPQDNPEVMSGAFGYRLYIENQAQPSYDSGLLAGGDPFVKQLTNNLHDLRLSFRWPLSAQGRVGNRPPFYYRTTVGGQLARSVDAGHPVYFFEPQTYLAAP